MDILAPSPFPAQIPPSEWSVEHHRRPFNHPVFAEPLHVECKVVSFAAGGFELTARTVDVQYRSDREMQRGPGGGGVRKPMEERSELDKLRASRRAKQMVRLLCRQIGAQYLL